MTHMHRVKHFCSPQQEVGIQGGECADPLCPIPAIEKLAEEFEAAGLPGKGAYGRAKHRHYVRVARRLREILRGG